MPLPLSGSLPEADMATVVAADVLARRGAVEGAGVAWSPAVLAGDLATLLAVERDLVRSGSDRASAGRAAFADRVRAHEAESRERVGRAMAALHVAGAAPCEPTDGDRFTGAARTAFVRLYEAGLLAEAERVVDLCPRCGTVVGPGDDEVVDVPGTMLVVRMELAGGGALDVDVPAPELLPGAVAVAVPEGDGAAGGTAVLPVMGRSVPVLADPDAGAAVLVVPAHDPAALRVAHRAGLAPIAVLDADGVVCQPPLAGLARYAARAAATALLGDEAAIAARRDTTEQTRRCRRCGTTLLPRLGRYWFLETADLWGAAGDALREGSMAFALPGGRDAFLEAAAGGGSWCLSLPLWAGRTVPVAVCADCGRPAVAVDPGESCGKCMGVLVPDPGVLDPRFVGAMAPLVAAGWPDDEGGPARRAPDTILLAGAGDIDRWVVPMAALGLRLAGAVPFGRVAVQERPAGEPGPGPDWEAVAGEGGGRDARLAVLSGDADLTAASRLRRLLEEPGAGDVDPDALAETFDAQLAAGNVVAALRLLASAAEEGVRPGAADRLRALAAPLLGG